MNDSARPQPLSPRPRQTVDGFMIKTASRRRYLDRPMIHADRPRPLPPIVQRQRLTHAMRPEIRNNNAAISVDQTARSLPKLDMDLPVTTSNPSRQIKRPNLLAKRSILRRWSFRAAVALLIAIIGIGGLLFGQGYFKLQKVFKGGASAAALEANVDPALLKGEGDGRVNILLLGRGGGDHSAPDLTDTIMLASIDPINHTAHLVSVPRDLWVNIPSYGSMKINAVWETAKYKYLGKISDSMSNQKAVKAGYDLIDQTVEQVLGVPIHYNALVDFQAFKQAVDTVGGVTINVPSDLWDPSMAWENNYNPVLAKAGSQNFNGKQALMYVRSRETSSDFARGERQRSVLIALKEKVVSLGTLSNPLKISKLMTAFGDNAQTDLSLNDTTRLYSLLKNVGGGNIKSVGLADTSNSYVTTGNINGTSVVYPRSGVFDYSAIQTYVRSVLKDGYLMKENAKIKVLNGTTVPGLATSKADQLKSYGYNVTMVDNAPTSGYSQTLIVDLTQGKSKYTKHYLEQRFGVKATTKLPDSAIASQGADFIVILGNNETADF